MPLKKKLSNRICNKCWPSNAAIKRHKKANKKQKIKVEMEGDVSESEDVSGEITNEKVEQSSYLFSITYSIYLSNYLWKYKRLNAKYSQHKSFVNHFYFLLLITACFIVKYRKMSN